MENKTNKEMLKNFGLLFRQLRVSRGYSSAEQFSFDFDLNRTAYWRWENGENITIKNFIRLCFIFDVSPKEFFELYERKYNSQKIITSNILNDSQNKY